MKTLTLFFPFQLAQLLKLCIALLQKIMIILYFKLSSHKSQTLHPAFRKQYILMPFDLKK